MKNRFTYYFNLIILPILYLIFTSILSGCATTQPIALEQVKVQPNSEIMKDCEELKFPIDGSLKEAYNTLFENKKIYLLCSEQNKAKKEFINNISK